MDRTSSHSKEQEIHFRRTVDSLFDCMALLNEVGVPVDRSRSIYCPFHDDQLGGKMSAKFYEERNGIYCWSCQRPFGPYDILTQLMNVPRKKLMKLVESKGGVIHDFGDEQRPLFREDKKHIVMAVRAKFQEGNIDFDPYVDTLWSCLETGKPEQGDT